MWKLKLEKNILQRDLNVKIKYWDYIGRQPGDSKHFLSLVCERINVYFDNIVLVAMSRKH